MSFLLQAATQPVDIHIVNIYVLLYGMCCSHSRSLAGDEARRHHPQASTHLIIGRYTATGSEQVAEAFRGEAAVGNAVRVALLVVHRHEILLVNVEIVSVSSNLIVEGAAGTPIVAGEHIVAYDTAAVASAESRSRLHHEGVCKGAGASLL